MDGIGVINRLSGRQILRTKNGWASGSRLASSSVGCFQAGLAAGGAEEDWN